MQPSWTPPPMAGPVSRYDGRIVAGAVLAFVGFLLQGIAAFVGLFFLGPFGLGFFVITALVGGIGSILIAVGLLLAFLGLAARR